MNHKIKHLISELSGNLHQASHTIEWDVIAMQGYGLAIEAATIDIAKALADCDSVQSTITTSAEGLTVEAGQYVFSVGELENILMHAFNIGAASTAKPRGPANQTWAERGF